MDSRSSWIKAQALVEARSTVGDPHPRVNVFPELCLPVYLQAWSPYQGIPSGSVEHSCLFIGYPYAFAISFKEVLFWTIHRTEKTKSRSLF